MRCALIGTSSCLPPQAAVQDEPYRSAWSLCRANLIAKSITTRGGLRALFRRSAPIRKRVEHSLQMTHAGWNQLGLGAAVAKDEAPPRPWAEVAARQWHRPEPLARRGFRQEPVVHF